MSSELKEREDRLTNQVDKLRAKLAKKSPFQLAGNSGANLVDGKLCLTMWGKVAHISLPDFVAYDAGSETRFDPLSQAILIYYLFTADNTIPTGEWMAFTELANGRFYTQAFQRYTGNELARRFGDNLKAFSQTAAALGGTAVPFADAAYRFQILPRVALLVACWLGDEDFLTSYRVLFDTAVNHYLPTDGCAILGNMLIRRLIKSHMPDTNLGTEQFN